MSASGTEWAATGDEFRGRAVTRLLESLAEKVGQFGRYDLPSSLVVKAAGAATLIESVTGIARAQMSDTDRADLLADLMTADSIVWGLGASSAVFFQGSFRLRELHRAVDGITAWIGECGEQLAARRPAPALPSWLKALCHWVEKFLSPYRLRHDEQMSADLAGFLQRLEDQGRPPAECGEASAGLRYGTVTENATGPPIQRFVQSQPDLALAPPPSHAALLSDDVMAAAA